MYEKIKAIKNNHIIISLLTSAIVVFLLWGIFIAQYFLSDGVTFARNGDTARQTFPGFIKMGELLSNGIIDGVDVMIVNGSNTIHSNGLEWNLPFRIFAYLGKVSSPLLMFVLFFAFYTFMNMYFTQRICYRYFKMTPALSFLIAITNLMLLSQWFISFYVIASLVIPLIYGMIHMLESNSKLLCVLSSFYFVAAFTSGYSAISCILALLVFLFPILYAVVYKINDIKSIIIRALSSALIGTAVCMPYLLTFLSGTGNSNVKSMTNISSALSLSVNPTIAIQKSFFFSSNAELLEQSFWIGLIWGFLIILFVFTKVTTKMEKGERIIFWTGVLLSVAVFLVDLRSVLPIDKWFYMIPAFGAMHLRRRYFHVVLPLLFISFGIALSKLNKIEKSKIILQSIIVYVMLMAGVYLFDTDCINNEALVVEIILTVVAIYIGITNGFMSKKFLLVFSFIMLCYQTNLLYRTEEVTATHDVIKNRSIAFDSDKQVILDSFVDNLSEKKIYKYVAVEGDGSAIPLYVPGNYGWYHRQDNLLSNYLKYPLHGGAISDDYRTVFGASWFDAFDTGYLHDSRADFAILTQEAYNKKPDKYNLSSDMERVYLNDTMFCAKLEKYIPRHYTDGELIKDENASLDNGYFYCPALTNGDIQNFDTNNYNYFNITVDAKTDTELQYCMFPHSNYTYYIDGEEYKPEIDYGLAYFKLTSGQHSVEIVYHDVKRIVIYWVFTIYYALVLIGSIISFVYYKIKGKSIA